MSWGRSTALLRLALISILAQTGALAAAQVKYKVTDMGAFQPLRVSQNGIAAGNGAPGGYAWDRQHGLIPIPGLDTSQVFYARDVNVLGQVVGFDFVHEGFGSEQRAYVWDRAGGTRVLADFGKYSNGRPIQSDAWGINDFGQVVGIYDKDGGLRWGGAFVYTPGQGWKDLPKLNSDRRVNAVRINNAAQAIGYSDDPAHPQGTPILWQPDGTIVELGHLLNQRQNFLGDINDNGAICGGSFGPLGNAGYFRAPDGTYTRILNPYNPSWDTYAHGLNNLNVVVGDLGTGNALAGFVWSADTGVQRIDELLDSASLGWAVSNGYSINDAGQIVARGRFNGGPIRGLLLEPVPEPTTVLFAIPAAWLMLRRRRRKG